MNAVMGCVLLVGLVFVTLNLIADALYPRLRSAYAMNAMSSTHANSPAMASCAGQST